MILVDTNIIIDYWKNPSDEYKEFFIDNEVAICGIVEAELIHGVRNKKQINQILSALANFNRIKIDDSLWIDVGTLLFKLKTSGITIPFQDVVLCALALKHDLTIWSKDNHFNLIRSVIMELKLIQK